MLSRKGAAGFTRLVGSPMVVKGAADGAQLPEGTRSALAALDAAGGDVVNMFFGTDYTQLESEVRAATDELMFGRINADIFVDRVQ